MDVLLKFFLRCYDARDSPCACLSTEQALPMSLPHPRHALLLNNKPPCPCVSVLCALGAALCTRAGIAVLVCG